MVSAFAAGAGLVLGHGANAEKSNEITAIPELLPTLALAGCTVTIDAMGTQTAIAQAIQERGADYVLTVKDNRPTLAESIEDFWKSFRAHPASHTPHTSAQSVEKNHAQTLAAQGNILTAFWRRDPTNGFLLIGIKVHGNTLARPIEIADQSTQACSNCSVGYAPVILCQAPAQYYSAIYGK